jgi:protein SCO1/2
MPRQPSLADLVERVRIVCTVYDPQTGRYRYDYGLILEIAGGLTFALAMLWFFVIEARNRRRERRA